VFPTARRDPLGFFLESARRFGDVVSMQFGRRRAYLLTHPDDVRRVLEDTQRIYRKSPTAARVRPLFGDSLTTVDGGHWHRQRRLIGPAFRPKSLLHSLSIVTETTAEMLDRWREIAERGEPVDMLREMTDLTQTIIVKLVFGDVSAAEIRAVGEGLQQALRHANSRLWGPLGSLDIPTPDHRRSQTALRTIDAFVSTMVARAREDGPPAGTLLSALLDAHDAEGGVRMRDADLCHELRAILVAGHTTTASALAWALYALSTNSTARESLRAELRDVLDGRPPGVEDLSALVYTRMVIDEVLRLYPPTWVTARTPLHDDHVRGYRIAAGSIVLLSPFVTHRHPAFWPEPNRFNPERFRLERSRSHFAYFPFGGGPRSCIGSWLASVEMQLVVAMVAQRYEFDLVPGSRVGVEPGLTLRPNPGVPMILHQNL
jgi:cytochrome P450